MRKLVRLRTVPLDAKSRRLGSCYDIADLRRVAQRRIPRPVFDYVDGAADEEIAVAANVAAFRSWRFLPRVLAGVAAADTSTAVFGSTLAVPMVLGPTGYTRMLHPDGEIGGARSAARHGLPYTLSTMATTGVEELRTGVADAGHAGSAELWFQLYLTRDRAQSYDLVDRAAANGYTALVVTVDTVVAGNRVRDLRNGLSIPPELTLATIASVAAKPSYWYRLLSGPELDYANFAGRPTTTIKKTAEFFDADLNWDDIAQLRDRWPGKLLLKGPVGPSDARRAVELGLDGVQLSNHGGRQLDRTVAPVDLIAPVRAAVGPSFTVLVDSGVRHGADVAIALALGADAAVLGRAYLYGLMVGGEAGVDRALDLLIGQFRSTMQFLGMTSVAELRKHGPDLLTRGALGALGSLASLGVFGAT
jgi:L-lactate dehydrogenase (cytochrome)